MTSSSREPLLQRALHADMGAGVIRWLGQHAPLPPRGLLAGQCVASALLALWGDGRREGPVRDVDVFRENPALLVKRSLAQPPEPQPPGVELRGTSREYFSAAITRSTRDGKLNLIEYRFVHADSERRGALARLLQDFDFNAVAVGVDLSHARLVWLPEFESFVRDGVLRLLNLSTPQHAWVRALRKFDDMPWLRGDAHALATQCVAALAMGRALGQFWALDVNERYAAERERLDPQRRYPRLVDWPWLQEEAPQRLLNRCALPPGWTLEDFEPIERALVLRAWGLSGMLPLEQAACAPVHEVLQQRWRFERALHEAQPLPQLRALAQRWLTRSLLALELDAAGRARAPHAATAQASAVAQAMVLDAVQGVAIVLDPWQPQVLALMERERSGLSLRDGLRALHAASHAQRALNSLRCQPLVVRSES